MTPPATSTDRARTIAFVQYSAQRDGSAHSGRILCEAFTRRGWMVHVAFASAGPMEALYTPVARTTAVVPHGNWLRTRSLLRFPLYALRERQAAARLQAWMAAQACDTVYINTTVSLAAAVAAHRLRLPMLWHLRELFDDVGGEMRCPAAWRTTCVRPLLRNWPRGLVAISNAVADNVLGSTRPSHLRIVPNAVEDRFFDSLPAQADARRRLGLPGEVLLLGVPGTLRPMKGHDFLLQALPAFLAACPHWHVAVTGAPTDAWSRDIVTRLGTLAEADRVHLLGDVADMTPFYAACDLVCVPSRAEPFGRVVIEAFAAGRPVVATAVGGIPEILRHGQTGLLVPAGDYAALEATLVRAAKDDSLREHLGGAARTEAERSYRVQPHGSRIADIITETCP